MLRILGGQTRSWLERHRGAPPPPSPSKKKKKDRSKKKWTMQIHLLHSGYILSVKVQFICFRLIHVIWHTSARENFWTLRKNLCHLDTFKAKLSYKYLLYFSHNFCAYRRNALKLKATSRFNEHFCLPSVLCNRVSIFLKNDTQYFLGP